MDPTKTGVYVATLSGGWDFETAESAEDIPKGAWSATDANGKIRYRVFREANEQGHFASAEFIIRDPQQIPLESLTKFVKLAVLERSAPIEAITGLRADHDRSTADARDIDLVGRKMAAMLECDYGSDA